jgi:hypothetical protein
MSLIVNVINIRANFLLTSHKIFPNEIKFVEENQ